MFKKQTNATGIDNVSIAADSTAPLVGIIEVPQPTSGGVVSIATSGVVYLRMSATATKGAMITATTGGKGIATTTNNQHIIGILMETCTSADELCPVFIRPGQVGA